MSPTPVASAELLQACWALLQELAQQHQPQAVSLLSNWKPSSSFIKSAVDSTLHTAKQSIQLRDPGAEQVVLLHGPSGVGKTSVALSLAKEFHSDQVCRTLFQHRSHTGPHDSSELVYFGRETSVQAFPHGVILAGVR